MPAYHVSTANPDRQAIRRELIARREALLPEERQRLSQRIGAHLLALLERLNPASLGFCWPYRGEAELLPAVTAWLEADAGRIAALPVVPDRPGPLEFRAWRPDSQMLADRFGIPYPPEGETLHPALLLVPVNGFDARGFRIGYGGGFFDRTLAALHPAPVTVGVGFELARLERVENEPHDKPLDWIVTELGSEPCLEVGQRLG